ncbi:MAG: hypothetical protein EXR83_12060 [Gammaproteobacteria bacterium]|nr:hypothetical protein [Gammaproteobacteria bacterium]
MKTPVVLFALITSAAAVAGDYNSSPNNYENSPHNFENSSANYNNSPHNFDNSPNKYGNDRLTHDNAGNVTGYAVPKDNGGVNFFDPHGDRTGYLPPTQ